MECRTAAPANPDLRLIEIKRVFTPTAGGVLLDLRRSRPGAFRHFVERAFEPDLALLERLAILLGAVVLGDYLVLKEGDEVRRTSRVLEVPVGPALVGRVVNPLGEPVDDNGAWTVRVCLGFGVTQLSKLHLVFYATAPTIRPGRDRGMEHWVD